MNHKIIADVVFAVIALGAVLALASRLRKPGTCRQRLAASLTIGAVLATVACAVMDTARHAALAAGHRPVLPQLAAGWVVITLAVGLVACTWPRRCGPRPAPTARPAPRRRPPPPAAGLPVPAAAAAATTATGSGEPDGDADGCACRR